MKHLLLFTIILAIAIITQPAFAQADSLNMTLLDEWEIPNDFHAGISPAPFCFIDSFIVVANHESTHVFKIDSLDQLVKLATHDILCDQVLTKDSLLFCMMGSRFNVYDFNSPHDVDSIGGFVNLYAMIPTLADTNVFYFHTRHSGRINIRDITNPFNSGISNTRPISPNYGPFFDGRYLYICGSKEFGEIYDYYTKSVLEVYDPYSFADSIAFKGRYLFGDDIIGHLSTSYFVEFIQDSFMIFGNYPNIFSIWKTNEERDSFELVSIELDSNFLAIGIKNIGDSLAIIAGKERINIYDISEFPSYSLLGSYKLHEPSIFSLAVNLPYIIVQYHDGTPSTNPIEIKLLKYTPSDGMNCSYNVKKENDFHIFPNPFNSSCSIELANNTQSIEITDIRGNTVKTVENPTSFNWQPQNLPSRLYFITVDFGETKITKKTVYLR